MSRRNIRHLEAIIPKVFSIHLRALLNLKKLKLINFMNFVNCFILINNNIIDLYYGNELFKYCWKYLL